MRLFRLNISSLRAAVRARIRFTTAVAAVRGDIKQLQAI
jgi:hypothetical protein